MSVFPNEYSTKSTSSHIKNATVCVGLVVDAVLNAEVLEEKAKEFVLERWQLLRGSLNTKVHIRIFLFYSLKRMAFALIFRGLITHNYYKYLGKSVLVHYLRQDGQF
jgi:hypothetical protein